MKIRTFFTWIFPAILILMVAVLLLLSRLLDRPLFGLPDLGIFRQTKTVSSELLLEEIRDLQALHTVEYIYKSVFPFDFLDPSINFETIIRTLRTGTGSVHSMLSPAEKEYLKTRDLASRLGIRFGRGINDFLVTTVLVRCGIDLAGVEFQITEGGPNSGKSGGKGIRLFLPGPAILDVIIEDAKPEAYPYPDVKLNPEQWRILAEFIEERIRDKVLTEGVLNTAFLNGKAFLTAILAQGGFTEIEISEKRK
jgi:hypothetical protein